MAFLLDGTRIYGNATIDSNLVINGNYAATSTTTGSLQLTGGAGISGNLVVGTNLAVGTNTVSYGRFEIDVNLSGAGGAARFINNASSSYTGELVQMITAQGSSTSYNILACYYSGGSAYAFKVRGDGTLFAQSTTIQSASDERFKENIVDSTDGLEIITALKPRRFDWKEGYGNGKKNQLGFIAQEINQVFPDATDILGESDDPENPYLSVGPGALIPVLVKAIQELKAQFDEYKASHP